jgi:two-component system, NarL family, invasion response regulator UvrY
MIRVLIVDDHRLVRIGLTRMLADAKGMVIVGEADSGERALGLVRETKPNVILMDLRMPGIGGLEATRRLQRIDAGIRVLIVTACDTDPYPAQAMKAGAAGYITKGANAADLEHAIRRVFLGQRHMSDDVAQQVALRSFDTVPECPFDQLSNREMQISLMVVGCRKVQQISRDLHLSPKTVNSYRYRIFEKLNVTSDVELALLAVRHGVIEGNRASPAPQACEPVDAEAERMLA